MAPSANDKVAPPFQKMTSLLIQCLTPVLEQPIKMSIADLQTGNHDPTRSFVPDSDEMLAECLSGLGVGEQRDSAEIGFDASCFGHPVAVLLAQLGEHEAWSDTPQSER